LTSSDRTGRAAISRPVGEYHSPPIGPLAVTATAHVQTRPRAMHTPSAAHRHGWLCVISYSTNTALSCMPSNPSTSPRLLKSCT